MNKYVLLLAFISIQLTGCNTLGPTKIFIKSDFNSDKAKKLLEPGDNAITGSALIRQRGGGVVSCAGNRVVLVPATKYAHERMASIYGNDNKGYSTHGFVGKQIEFSNSNPEYLSLIKVTQCDAQGYFKFNNLSDGAFFVTTSIVWQVNNYFKEGGSLMHRVELFDGTTKNIVLAP